MDEIECEYYYCMFMYVACSVVISIDFKLPLFYIEIEAQVKQLQANRSKNVTGDENKAERIGLGAEGHFDTDIYSSSKLTSLSGQYVDSIAPNDEQDVCAKIHVISSCRQYLA